MSKILMLASILWATTCATELSADESAPSDAVIEEVLVVGNVLYQNQVNALRTPTPILDVPQSVVVITGAEIQNRGFASISGLISYIPGLNSSQGEGHRDAVVFRGVRSTADFCVDGMRDDVQYYRSLYNLEQVEVLKGPNALLFGRGGTGGVLNRVMKKGVLGSDFTAISTAVETFGGASLQVDRNVSINAVSALRINGFYENLENHRDFFDGSRFGLNPSAKFQLSEATTLDVSYEYLNNERFIDRGIPTGANGRPVVALQDIIFGDPTLNTTTLEASLFKGLLQHRFSDSVKGNLSAFYGDYDKMYQNFYASSYSEASPDHVTLDGYLDTTQRENLVISGNLLTQMAFGAFQHTILVGAELLDTASNQDRYNAYWDTTLDDNEIFAVGRPLALSNGVGVSASGMATSNDFTTDLNDDTHVQIRTFSLYLQDEIRLTEHFRFVLGARFDEFDIDVFNIAADENRSRTDSEVSPRLGVIYKPVEEVSIYASYSESFLPRSGEQFANINGNKDQLDPDTFANMELGLKWNLTDRLNLAAAIFEIEKSSPQVADSDPSTLDVIDSTIEGFELQLQGQVTDSFGMSLGYSNLDGEQVDRQGPTGLRPRELPQSMVSLWTTYQMTPQLGIGLGLTHQGESYINNSNTATLPSYTRVDAAVYYDVSESLTLQLNLDNLGDKLYFPNAHSTHQATVGESINARVSINWRP
ncbi:MAG: TonB-dependent siderophore receptor [Proteobacteria bacterium]|nr:TonB-dependent siderophore receptor [Pseudomonadota bacterium]